MLRLKLYRLGDPKTPVDVADFKLVNEHARPHGSAEYQLLSPRGHRRTPRGEGGRHGAEEPDAVVVAALDVCFRGGSIASFRCYSDDSVVDGRHDTLHDDVDESADVSELYVSDQGPVEPVHEVVPGDLQAEIDFIETASRHQLPGGGSEFNGMGDGDDGPSSVAFGGDADEDCRRRQRGHACG